MPASLSSADQLAFDHAMVGEPVWNRIQRASDIIPVEPNCLLHAGPPFPTSQSITRPILNSACVAAVYEGLAQDLDQAEMMILNEDVILQPAQDYNVVTPLAAVVSPRMPLQVVYDAHRGMAKAFAPINGGNTLPARLGLKSMPVVDHLKWLNQDVAHYLERGLAEGIDLIPIAHESLKHGDDCHGRTQNATRLLVDELKGRMPDNADDKRVSAFLEECPALFLNLWMAATKCMLRLAEDIDGSTLVTTAGGNGLLFGIKVASNPKEWVAVPATPPKGKLDSGVTSDRATGALGDSAIVDAFGLGAMAIHLNPDAMQAMKPYLPSNLTDRRDELLLCRHIGFRELNLKFGLTARGVSSFGQGPVISLGIIDAQGKRGRLGGGIYEAPLELFEKALEQA